jgi:hypothetical protein
MNELCASLLFFRKTGIPRLFAFRGATRSTGGKVTGQDRHPHPARTALQVALTDSLGGLTADQVAVAACVFATSPRQADPGPWLAQKWWGHREGVAIYPASVMKLFVLAGLAAFRADGRMAPDAEDDRAAAAMIRISSNEATAYLMGRLSGAEDGSSLDETALDQWCQQRAKLQDWYLDQNRREYAGLSLLHATYQDSPYGRAFQARRAGNANRLSGLAAAALLHDIVRGAAPGSAWMLDLLQRDFQRQPGYFDPEGDQVTGFLAQGLPAQVQTWSKAGHTSTTRHDILFGENPDGSAFLLSVMTEGAWTARNGSFLPAFAREFHSRAFPKP